MKTAFAVSIGLGAVLAGCAQEQEPRPDRAPRATQPDSVEDFAAVFERMKADQAFTRSRIAADFAIHQYFHSPGSDWEGVSRTTLCSPGELQRKGWARFLSRDELAREGVEYGTPELHADGRITVQLAAPESDVIYSDYTFVLSDGRWLWSSEDVSIEHNPDARLRPHPCGSGKV